MQGRVRWARATRRESSLCPPRRRGSPKYGTFGLGRGRVSTTWLAFRVRARRQGYWAGQVPCPGRFAYPGEHGRSAPLRRGVSVGRFGVHSGSPTTLAGSVREEVTDVDAPARAWTGRRPGPPARPLRGDATGRRTAPHRYRGRSGTDEAGAPRRARPPPATAVILRRQVRRPRCSPADRALLVLLASRLRAWPHALLLVQPDTLLRRQRQLSRWHWHRTSRATAPAHRPAFVPETIALIREMAAANRLWGAERIWGELLKLDIRVAKSTIQKYLRQARPPHRSGQS